MKPKYSEGVGVPPVYLSDISLERAGAGKLVFSGGTLKGRQVRFLSKEDLKAKLRLLMERRVPLSVGGHAMGPADHVQMLMDSGQLADGYIQIAWTRQGHWVVREMLKGATEWDAAVSADTFATTTFDPASIED